MDQEMDSAAERQSPMESVLRLITFADLLSADLPA
jgi:hypothetical protein